MLQKNKINMKPKIGLIGLTAELYHDKVPELVKDLTVFSNVLKKIVDTFADVIHVPVVYKRKQMEHAYSKFMKEDVDGVILVFLSYSPSLIISPVLKKNQNIPVLLWNTQNLAGINKQFNTNDTMYNHGMHGVQDLASVLTREKIRFCIITGHYKDKETVNKISRWCQSVSLIKFLKRSKIGRIGNRFKDMGDFAISDIQIKKCLGPTVVDIPLAKISSESAKINKTVIQNSIIADRKKYKVSTELTEQIHYISTRMELSLRRIIAKEKLDGLAINFMGFNGQKGVESIPFMAIGKFLAEGMGYAGEGDVLCAVSVLILQKLFGTANFVEMFTTDYENNRIFFEHMGESNPAMANNKNQIMLVKKDLPLIGPGIATAMFLFQLKPGQITLFNIAPTRNGVLKFIVGTGKILRVPLFKDICSPHFLMQVDGDVKDFLTNYSLAGGTHHLAMVYGNRIADMEVFSDLIGIKLIKI